MNDGLAKIRSVHTYVIPWMFDFGWQCNPAFDDPTLRKPAILILTLNKYRCPVHNTNFHHSKMFWFDDRIGKFKIF